MPLLNKYKLNIPSRRKSNDSEIDRRTVNDDMSSVTRVTKNSFLKDHSYVSRDSRRQTHTEREFSADFTNKENDHFTLFDANSKPIKEYIQEDLSLIKSHKCCNSEEKEILINKIDKLDNFMKMHSSLMSHQMQGILDILYNLKEELDYVRNSIQISDYVKHIDKQRLEKETQTMADKWLVTFNRQSSSIDSVKWKCTESLDSKSPENDCTNSNPSQQSYEKQQQENKLRDISSLASVFNLSQTFEKKEHNVDYNKIKPNFDYEYECRLEPEIKVQEISNDSFPLCDSYKSNNTIKTQMELGLYLQQLKSSCLINDCEDANPKFISFLNKIKKEEIKSSTISSIPTEIEQLELKDTCNFDFTQRDNCQCNNYCNSTFRDKSCECMYKDKLKVNQNSKKLI